MTKVIGHTPATNDQEHIPTIVCSACDIPDRTAAILGYGPDPLPAMRRALGRLERGGAEVIAIPCNTAHVWHAALQAKSSAQILHIVDAVADQLEPALGAGPIGLLATTGTVEARLYPQRLASRGIDCIAPEPVRQTQIMRAIALVKAGGVTSAHSILAAEATRLAERGCRAVVMACTEIPIALADQTLPVELIDATDALARACVEACLGFRPIPGARRC
jgi:aspartate racemase